mmetsp:Transcript_29456/g.83078  ORF Transcript_29456/g.83078 Transcript_29456/m.83078 type:complete len:274 (-) Transcript_29456:155-976(-)
MMGKWYAVAKGRQTGVFKTWDECQKHVKGFSGASFKSFRSEAEARQFVGQAGSTGQVRLSHKSSGSALQRSPPRKQQKHGSDQPSLRARARHLVDEDEAGPSTVLKQNTPAPGPSDPLPSVDPELKYVLRFDGGSRGNPGLAGAGAAIWGPDGEMIWHGWFWVGEKCTNNMAEATGLLRGLQQARILGIIHLEVEGDSDLLIKQLNGQYQVKNPALQSFHKLFRELAGELASVKFTHIYRNHNKEADNMANRAMDTRRNGEEYFLPGQQGPAE